MLNNIFRREFASTRKIGPICMTRSLKKSPNHQRFFTILTRAGGRLGKSLCSLWGAMNASATSRRAGSFARATRAPSSPRRASQNRSVFLDCERSEKHLATPRGRPELVLKDVTLRESRKGWPAGTWGTVLLAFDDGALVEIRDDEDCALVMLPVPYDALDLRKPLKSE